MFQQLSERRGLVIGVTLLITALLSIPFLTMEPTESASQEPAGPVFDARDRLDERFVSSVFPTFMIVEDRNGDILRQEPLLELLSNEDALRSDPDIGPTLISYFDSDSQFEVNGVISIADLIDDALTPVGGLAAADDTMVKTVGAQLIDQLGQRSNLLGLSAQTTFDEATGTWIVPAVTVQALASNDVLGFGNLSVSIGGGTEPEEYSREVVETIRGSETNYQAWGVAIDVNLTAEEQGTVAGPFIGFTILAVLLIVGLTFRSYWVLAVSGAALASLIIWLQGISNLIGLKDDLILSLIVPIAMISFGVDFAFHALGRYREEQAEGLPPRRAFVAGLTAVSAALLLALASDSVAFLANVSSGIESIVQFGIGAAIALIAAYLLLGIVTPLLVSGIEQRIGDPTAGRRSQVLRTSGAIGAGLLAMTTVLLQVFILPWAGVVALGVQIVLTLVLPYWYMARKRTEDTTFTVGTAGSGSPRLGRLVAAVARRRAVVVPVLIALTVGAAFLAFQVPTEFDAKDFFSADTDFVVGLDKLDEHVGDTGGEPADIYIEADITQPNAVAAIREFIDEAGTVEGPFARDEQGLVRFDGGVLDVLEQVTNSPAALGALAAAGIDVTDANSDGIPDTSEQLEAVYGFTREFGVPFDSTRLVLTPDRVHNLIYVGDDGHATRLQLGLTDTRSQENVAAAADALEPSIDALRTELRSIDPAAEVELTGSPVVRMASLAGISNALQRSLPISVVLCLLIAAAFMRSFRYGTVTIVPILMTVAWLYAFMQIFGFAINIVTATIGAVSIGIGIDFAIHYAVRYRQELAATNNVFEAVERAGEGTGGALVASATSSIVGFLILALAPMPLFASYGLLTAVMIAMAGAATLLVLPSLLTLVTHADGTSEPAEATSASGAPAHLTPTS